MKIQANNLYRLLLFKNQLIWTFNDDEMEAEKELSDDLPLCFNRVREGKGLRPLRTYRDLQGMTVKVYGRTCEKEDYWIVYSPDVNLYVFRLMISKQSLKPLCECPVDRHYCNALREEKEAMGYRWNRWTKMWMEPKD